MEQEVVFIVLSLDNKSRVICDLTEKYYNSGKHVILYVENERQADDLDKMLWTWKQSSFIPHINLPNLTAPTEEPVVITQSFHENMGYDILIQVTPVQDEIRKQFPLVIDFAEKYDVNALQRSRDRYRKLQQEHVKLKSMQAGEFMHASI